MFNSKKNNPIRIHSIGEEKKQYSPEGESQKVLNELFNELLKRPDYKKFDYGHDLLKTPHIKAFGGKSDTRATYYNVTQTDLYHYRLDKITGCSTGEKFIVTRLIKSFGGKEIAREYKFGKGILSLEHIPRPDLARLLSESKTLVDSKKEKARKAHARSAILAEEENRRDKVENYLRSQSVHFSTGSSTEELGRIVTRLKATEA